MEMDRFAGEALVEGQGMLAEFSSAQTFLKTQLADLEKRYV
jgi:hypothetical protein